MKGSQEPHPNTSRAHTPPARTGTRRPPRATRGFTLLELLFVLALTGLLATLGMNTLAGTRARQQTAATAQQLAQDIQACRARGMSDSTPWRLRFTTPAAWVVEQDASTTATPRWTTRREAAAGPGTTTDAAPGDTITFDTRGYLTLALKRASGEIRVSGHGTALRVIPSMAGSVKVAAP